jgi:hypothetical protein
MSFTAFTSDREHYIVNFTSSQDIKVTWEEILVMGQRAINNKYPVSWNLIILVD